jgi:hypothetical protein
MGLSVIPHGYVPISDPDEVGYPDLGLFVGTIIGTGLAEGGTISSSYLSAVGTLSAFILVKLWLNGLGAGDYFRILSPSGAVLIGRDGSTSEPYIYISGLIYLSDAHDFDYRSKMPVGTDAHIYVQAVSPAAVIIV